MKKILIVALILGASVCAAYAEEEHALERIVVTPSRIRTPGSGYNRSVTVLGGSSTDGSYGTAITDTIAAEGGIDVRRRGPEGVQADINIRGTTFEENSVLIDGVRINDPQTGHYTMDLPITAADIDRIEILKGPGSSIYGPNSFGGTVNIITKKPGDKKVTVEALGGSFDFFKDAVSVTCPIGFLKDRFSFEQSRSTGYRPETEFNNIALSNTASVDTPFGGYNFLFGFAKKDYGANQFYSNLYPDEEEHTDTRFFTISGISRSGPLTIEPKLFLRRHRDKFLLDRNRPGWQTNYHTTYEYGLDTTFTLENRMADTAYGFEVSEDTIDSTSLQTHHRLNSGFYAEIAPHIFEPVNMNISMRADHFSGFGWQYSPSISASYPLSKGFTIRSMAGRSYRIPTFTDLYYIDRGNIGNSSLGPESAWSYEAGLDYRNDSLHLSSTFFHRDSENTIDWTRLSARDPWRASNTGGSETNGFELSFNIEPAKLLNIPGPDRVFLGYTVLDTYAKHDYLSKYALDYLKQHISGGCEFTTMGFKNRIVLNYKKRIGDSGSIIVDGGISRKIFRKGSSSFEVFCDITNIFDTPYSEQSDIPMPGRWIRSGGRIEF
ncbi:MAG: TonB-dependent receptor [Candidatus Omnitrophota bacterium]|jgi:iron complex outermembrane receptor protein